MRRSSRKTFLHLVWIVCILFFPLAASTQDSARHDSDREHAIELYKQGRFVEAMPLFEKLSAGHPSDGSMKELWAWCIFQYAGTLPDPEQRQKSRVFARKIALKAQELGDNSRLLQTMLEFPENGADPVYSSRKEVDETMRAAAVDYSGRDLEKARPGLLRVLVLDPNNYKAAFSLETFTSSNMSTEVLVSGFARCEH